MGRVLEGGLPLAVPGEVVVVLVVAVVEVLVDFVGGRGGLSLETWEDNEAVEVEDFGGSNGWVVSRGPGPLTK